MNKKKLRLSTIQIILLSFLITIVLGSVLLVLPISSANGRSVAYVDALFTATTATCVTGLVTLPTFSTWSLFGQIVILVLIQIGGLGVITVMTGCALLWNRKLGIKDNQLLQDAFNLNTFAGLKTFVKKVIVGTLLIEGVGALLYMTVFVPELGARGVWVSVFNAVSAFCNAGMDVLGENSLCGYALNPLVTSVTGALIVVGGLGYIVWWDILRVLKEFGKVKFRCFQKLTLHSKLVLLTTVILIFGGCVLICALEYDNPLTLGGYSFIEKIGVSLFQSITTRTAGFATLPQENLKETTCVICMLLMFIGGSPVGTAGGVKTVTFAVLILSAVSTIRNKNETGAFGRNIPARAVAKALAVTLVSAGTAFVAAFLLGVVTDVSMLDAFYEAVSATATVGLSRNLTPFLSVWGKGIIIATMYLGRIGPISLALAVGLKKEKENVIKNPTEEISVG